MVKLCFDLYPCAKNIIFKHRGSGDGTYFVSRGKVSGHPKTIEILEKRSLALAYHKIANVFVPFLAVNTNTNKGEMGVNFTIAKMKPYV